MADDSTIERYKLEQQKKSGAAWFLWVAALSIINTLFTVTGTDFQFILGLGVTQIVDALFSASPTAVRIIGFVIDCFFAAAFLGVWWMARRYNWAFITGMMVYAADALIFLFVQEWVGLGFHVFALVGMFAGLKAAIKLAELPADAAASDVAAPAVLAAQTE
jgi:hypothetical protein